MALELQSIIHKDGTFDKEGISNSVQQELIYVYKKLYDINMGFTITHSSKIEPRLLFPQIIYNDIHIKRNKIFFFLKKLINLKDLIFLFSLVNNQNSDVNIEEYDLDLIEKEVLVDMQYLLIYYSNKKENTGGDSQILRALGFLLQPILRLKDWFKEEDLIEEISKQFNVTTKNECFNRIKQINENIEEFIEKLLQKNNMKFESDENDNLGVDKKDFLINQNSLRPILHHPLILLIHCNYIVMKKIFDNSIVSILFIFKFKKLIIA